MTRLSFREAELGSLVTLWNRFFPVPYRIGAEVFRINSVDSPLFDWGASQVAIVNGEPVGFAIVKRSAAKLYRGPDKDHAHLSSIVFADPTVAVDLMKDVKTTLANRGICRLHFGQDSRHFFPGCPTDVGSLCSFLMVEGFEEGGEVVDLEADLREVSRTAEAPSGESLRLLTAADQSALDAFLAREFPGRWHHDVRAKVQAEGIQNTIFGMLDGPEVVGFALLQNRTHRLPIGGAVWHGSLGSAWGSLGPIGVAAALRGKGRGHALLAGGLQQLRAWGCERTIIDWTTLVDYYGGHGFAPTRRYRTMSLDLERRA